jgi:hypothetical protein
MPYAIALTSKEENLQKKAFSFTLIFLILGTLSACQKMTLPPEGIDSSVPTASSTAVPADAAASSTPQTTLQTTPAIPSTITPGPSPTSTSLPPLKDHTWQAKAVMIEAALIQSQGDSVPFPYTPIFILYGDGLIIRRQCQSDVCQFFQSQLDPINLCQLVYAVDRTGFLDAALTNYQTPGESLELTYLSVSFHKEKAVLLDGLRLWMETPNWYAAQQGCQNCFEPPRMDPAFQKLYQLITTYDHTPLQSYQSSRLAIWISKPVLAGTPQPWPITLIPLEELASRTTCSGDEKAQAVVLEGKPARDVSELLAKTTNEGNPTVFTQGESVWQVESRWLIPYEMPKTCSRPAGLYPPPTVSAFQWQCSANMGAIPSPTPTITTTPTLTPTPIR